jgi:hypothetical protein
MASLIQEHDCVVLTQDVTDHGLIAGDVGTVVHVYDNYAAYEVEFVTPDGGTFALITVLPSQMRLANSRDMRHAREFPPRKDGY